MHILQLNAKFTRHLNFTKVTGAGPIILGGRGRPESLVIVMEWLDEMETFNKRNEDQCRQYQSAISELRKENCDLRYDNFKVTADGVVKLMDIESGIRNDGNLGVEDDPEAFYRERRAGRAPTSSPTITTTSPTTNTTLPPNPNPTARKVAEKVEKSMIKAGMYVD